MKVRGGLNIVTIPIKTHLDPNGVLSLRVSTGLPEADVEVILVVQPVAAQANAWPEDFFDETYGAFAGHSIERESQEGFDDREVLR